MTPQPVFFPEPLHFARIDCGDRTSFAITKDYDIYTWGFNETRATGHPSISGHDVYRPRKLDLSKMKGTLDAKTGDSSNANSKNKKVRVHAVGCGGQHTILLVSTMDGNNENLSPK
jgi:hypothetical protein